MRAYEILTEEQLDEINRRDFLRKAGLATMYAGLGVAAVDQGSQADKAEKDEDEEEEDEE
jgi:hypothetical protein